MFKKFMSKTVGVFTATVVIVAGLVALPTTANADEPQQQPLDPPTSVSLVVDIVNSSTTTLKATLDKPLEDSQSTLSLYKVGNPLTQQTATTGEEISFTVNNPATVDYEEYYVAVGNLVSNSVTVNNVTNQWNISISTLNSTFQTDEHTLTLNWVTNQPVTGAQQAIWITNKTDNETLWVEENINETSGSIAIPWFATGAKKEYIAYVAPYNNEISAPDQIADIATSSNSVFFQRKTWSINLSTSTTQFSQSDPDPIISWETNQPVLTSYRNYAVFTVNADTGEIINVANSLTGEYEFNHRFYTGNAQTYEAYIAYYDWNLPYSNVNDLTDIQAKSNTINVSRAPWEVTLSINQEEFSSDSPTPIITWETNQTLKHHNNTWGQYGVYFAETSTGEIWSSIGGNVALSSSSLEIPRFYDGAPREYMAYVAQWQNNTYVSNVSQLQDIQATSNTVYTERVNWELTLDIDKTIFSTGEQPKITWQTNQSVGATNGNYGVYIVNVDTEEIVQHVGGHYSLGTTSDYYISDFYTGEVRKYKAYVAKWKYDYYTYTHVSDLEDIQAISNTVEVSRSPWEISITADRTSFQPNEPTPLIFWNTNQSVGATFGNYAVYTVDETTGQIIGTNFSRQEGTTNQVQISGFQYEDSHTYRAYIAEFTYNANLQNKSQLTGIQAMSNIVTIHREPWELSFGSDRISYPSQGPSPLGTWSTNQAMYHSGYSFFLIDTQTNEIKSKWYQTNELSGLFDMPTYTHGGPWTYKIVIAKINHQATHLSDLTNIQATSGTVTVRRAVWNLTLATSLYAYIPNAYKAVLAEVKTNQSLQHSQYYWVYIANRTTGAILGSSHQGEYQTGASFFDDANSDGYIAYIAAPDPTLNTYYYRTYTHISDLEDIQAVSNVSVMNDVDYETLTERYQGGGNPSEGNCNQQCYGDPVNSYNGEFFENETDLSISSAIPFDFSRSYSSNNTEEPGAFGAGWTHNYNMSLSGDNTTLETSGKIKVIQENGSVSKFTKVPNNGTEIFVAPTSTLATLEYDSTTDKYLFTRRNNTTYVFNAETGKLEQIKDLNNNYLNLTYTNDKLTQIINNTGKTLTISWVGSSIAFISDGIRTVSYDYSPAGNLEIVDFPDLVGNKQYIYDTEDRITSIVHPNGGAYHNLYDTENRVIEQTDPLYGVTQFNYENNQTTITLPDGSVNRENYDMTGQLSSKTMAVGTSLESVYSYNYDFTGQVNAEYGPSGLIASYTHDYYGNTLSATNAAQQTYRYTYNELNQLVEITNPAGKISKNTYDDKGNLLATESYASKVTEYEINANGTNASITSPQDVVAETGKKVLFSYDANGHVNSATQPEGGSVSMVNDILGNPVSVTNALNQTVDYAYNTNYQLTEVEAPNGATTETKYDNAGRITSETDALGRETTYTYDLMNRVTSITSVLGTVEYQYDANGKLLKEIDVDDTETHYEYDALGRVVSVTDPNGNEQTSTYYNNSLLKSVTDALGNTTHYDYDTNGNVIQITDAMNNVSSASYDNLNRLTSTTSSNGYSETYVYDDDSQLVQVVKAGIETTKYEYDANGNLIKTIYPDNSFELRTYDSNNSLKTVTDRDGKVSAHEYNAGGQLTKTIRPDLTETVYAYTDMGQLDSISYDNWATIDTEYVYDIAGRVASAFKNGIETTYSYDSIGHLTQRGPPIGDGVEYSYNQYGELDKLTYPSGVELEYDYDNNGNLLTVDYDNETLAEYTYDANNNNTRVDYGNGTFEEYDFDDLNRLSQFTINNQTSELYKKQLELNSVGFIIGSKTNVQTSNAEDKTYSYTDVQRLENVTNNLTNITNTYEFDTSSNLTSSQLGTNTFTANGQLTSSNLNTVTASYSHDLRGNRTAVDYIDTVNTNKTKNTTYAWSNDNRLIDLETVTVENDENKTTTDAISVTYEHDISGLTTQKNTSHETTVNEQGNITSTVTSSADTYTWDILSDIPTLIEDDQNNYVYGLGSAPIAQIKKNAVGLLAGTEYLHGDERGSIIAATSPDGDLSWTRTYDEYGTVVEEIPNTGVLPVLTPFAYAGEYLDSDTGLYNLRARWYEPTTASFINIDPAVLSTGEAYSYASANPLMYTDPLGLWSQQNTWNSVVGFVDGVTGIPFLSNISNSMFPGSVNLCSVEYQLSNIAGTITSFFVPALGPLKLVGVVAAVGTGVAKTIGAHTIAIAAIAAVTNTKKMINGKALFDTVDYSKGIEITLKYKKGWTTAQKTAADEKVNFLNSLAEQGKAIKTMTNRKKLKSHVTIFAQGGGQKKLGHDIDHKLELQLGGKNIFGNLWVLDKSVNRSIGSQIKHQLKAAPYGTIVNKITITER